MRRFLALVILAVIACATPAPPTHPSPTPGAARSGAIGATPSASAAAASQSLATAADGRSWACIASDPAFSGLAPYAAAASSSVEVVVGLGAIWWREIP